MIIPTTVKDQAMSTTAKVPPAKLARIVERIRHHLYRLHQRLTPAPAAMIEMILAGWTSQAITVAAQLGVADAQMGELHLLVADLEALERGDPGRIASLANAAGCPAGLDPFSIGGDAGGLGGPAGDE